MASTTIDHHPTRYPKNLKRMNTSQLQHLQASWVVMFGICICDLTHDYIPRVVTLSGTKRLIPTEVCERIIDFVAVRWEQVKIDYSGGRIWDSDVAATLQACSLTCHALRPRSQFYLMRVMSMRASIADSRSFNDMRALFRKIPRLRDDVESLSIDGTDLEIPRFHLVPLEIFETLPNIPTLMLSGGLVYMPTAFRVCMRRFMHLTHLRLFETTFSSANDLRRMLESLRNLKSLALLWPEWSPYNQNRQFSTISSSPKSPRSCVRLEKIELSAEAKWIRDHRTIHFLDWLSSSGVISQIEQLRLDELMLLDNGVVAAVDRMLRAALISSKLHIVCLNFSPEVDLTPCECGSVVRAPCRLQQITSAPLPYFPPDTGYSWSWMPL